MESYGGCAATRVILDAGRRRSTLGNPDRRFLIRRSHAWTTVYTVIPPNLRTLVVRLVERRRNDLL
jgi:hypothetical protein